MRQIEFAATVEKSALNVNGRNGSALAIDNPFETFVARDLFHGSHIVAQRQRIRPAAFYQCDDEVRHADAQRRCVFAHVGVARDNVKSPKLARVAMRFVACIHQWPIRQSIDALQHVEKIGALRKLIIRARAFFLAADFSRARVENARS